MKIGLISDSHGRAKRLCAALRELVERGVDVIVHCGDIGGTECIELLADAAPQAYAVTGNMDRGIDALRQVAGDTGVNFATEVLEVPLGDGRSLGVTHGNDPRILGELIAAGQFCYICHGHTHRFRDEWMGGIRVINPGALAHPRYPRHPTAAVLDTDTDALQCIDLTG
ncbi:MAG: metallophosphoesterase family protein [Planctomycetota bacterium]|jgi:putative phosphoesterase